MCPAQTNPTKFKQTTAMWFQLALNYKWQKRPCGKHCNNRCTCGRKGSDHTAATIGWSCCNCTIHNEPHQMPQIRGPQPSPAGCRTAVYLIQLQHVSSAPAQFLEHPEWLQSSVPSSEPYALLKQKACSRTQSHFPIRSRNGYRRFL
jgi:hypothetical protein